ncbi:ABC transporter substrate-binding protein [Intrasporangium sp.]|uniref:ABC transporter substrate-binding protein n=1 Tax=Intrasporangium sp. TaxID=1925024 RepID=UPI00293B5471|nr:ABC transporter substrate-binding protein [Intrasporangium sp.]MDV3221402.1 ABC transporter substrate-binding protein [Intrasporangium sp.]
MTSSPRPASHRGSRLRRVGRLGAVLTAVVALGSSAACTPEDLIGSGRPDDTVGTAPTVGPPQAGGALHVLVADRIATWDPQLMYVGPEAFFAQRTFVRTLTTYGTGDRERDLVGDLATDTGTESNGGRTWTFTLRDGVKWQDGTPVTCEDVRHGVARTFDRKTHVGGTNYATFLLDVPTKVTSEGLEKPTYSGPADKKNAKSFLKAVQCKDRRITFHLRAPERDFPHIVALPEFAPRKAAADSKTGKASHAVFSTGPYQLDRPWQPGKGGTFVRNKHWDPDTDLVRQAYPDTIVVTSGLSEATVIERLLNQEGSDAHAVSWVKASPTLRHQAGTALGARLTFPYTGSVDYLALNMRSPVMSKDVVRKAFALSTNRATYVTANGGEGAGSPTWSVLGPGISEAGLRPPQGARVEGDPEAARTLLTDAGVTLPVRVRVVHARSLLIDKAYAALEAGWERAGFEVERTTVPPEEYYQTIEKPSAGKDYDVFRGAWLPDIPSASGVLPALFDARINIDSSGPGQDVGYFDDKDVAKLMDRAQATADPAKRAAVWAEADALIRERGGYVALAATKVLHIHGAGVLHYDDHAVGGIVDLATVAVR